MALNTKLSNMRGISACIAVVVLAASLAVARAANGEGPQALSEEDISETFKDWGFFFFLAALFTCVLAIFGIVHKHLHVIPESVACILIGIAFGLVMRVLGAKMSMVLQFNTSLFFFFVLPPIIFEAGFNLPKSVFMDNLVTILLLAIFGTIISQVVVTAGLLGLQRAMGYVIGFDEASAFGALISATDPVATLSIFSALSVDPVLYMLVFGESVLNDAMAIILYRIATVHMNIGVAIGDLVYIMIGSTIVGWGIGMLNALFYKRLPSLMPHSKLVVVFMVLFSYAPYLVAEGLGMSGLIAIFACGIVEGNYASPNLSPHTQLTVNGLFRLIAFLCETSLFLFVGLSVGSMSYDFNFGMVFVATLMCLIGRALNVFPLVFLANLGRKSKIDWRTQFMVWFSGLRGGVAFGVAMDLPEGPVKQALITTTLMIVLLTIAVMGGSTMPLLKRLKLNVRVEGVESITHQHLSDVELPAIPEAPEVTVDPAGAADDDGRTLATIGRTKSKEEISAARLEAGAMVAAAQEAAAASAEADEDGSLSPRTLASMMPFHADGLRTGDCVGWYRHVDVLMKRWLLRSDLVFKELDAAHLDDLLTNHVERSTRALIRRSSSMRAASGPDSPAAPRAPSSAAAPHSAANPSAAASGPAGGAGVPLRPAANAGAAVPPV